MIRKKKRRIRWDRVVEALCVISSASFFLWMIFYCYISPSIRKNKAVSIDNYRITSDRYFEEHKEEFRQFQNTNWKVLVETGDIEQMESASQVVVNYLLLDLGVEGKNITVSITDLKDRRLGQFSNADKAIQVDSEFIKRGNSPDVINVLCHESFHCFQHSCMEAYRDACRTNPDYENLFLFRSAKQYLEEYRNYISADSGDYEGYANQELEIDARAFAEETEKALMLRIDMIP